MCVFSNPQSWFFWVQCLSFTLMTVLNLWGHPLSYLFHSPDTECCVESFYKQWSYAPNLYLFPLKMCNKKSLLLLICQTAFRNVAWTQYEPNLNTETTGRSAWPEYRRLLFEDKSIEYFLFHNIHSCIIHTLYCFWHITCRYTHKPLM